MTIKEIPMELKLIKIGGNSKGIIIPKNILELADTESGTIKVKVELKKNK
ncbi:MAG: hypothetical protein WCR79_01725 [Fusobacterium sp.]